MTKGYVQVYTGDGKGKTPRRWAWRCGPLARACGCISASFSRMFPVVQPKRFPTGFRKSRCASSAVERVCFWDGTKKKEDRECAQRGFAACEEAIRSQAYDLVILDEINVAVSLGLVSEGQMLSLLKHRPSSVELVLTGRGACESVQKAADLVTELCERKHYFHQGVAARRGIEE